MRYQLTYRDLARFFGAAIFGRRHLRVTSWRFFPFFLRAEALVFDPREDMRTGFFEPDERRAFARHARPLRE